jgi:hypothetical protein
VFCPSCGKISHLGDWTSSNNSQASGRLPEASEKQKGETTTTTTATATTANQKVQDQKEKKN